MKPENLQIDMCEQHVGETKGPNGGWTQVLNVLPTELSDHPDRLTCNLILYKLHVVKFLPTTVSI